MVAKDWFEKTLKILYPKCFVNSLRIQGSLNRLNGVSWSILPRYHYRSKNAGKLCHVNRSAGEDDSMAVSELFIAEKIDFTSLKQSLLLLIYRRFSLLLQYKVQISWSVTTSIVVETVTKHAFSLQNEFYRSIIQIHNMRRHDRLLQNLNLYSFRCWLRPTFHDEIALVESKWAWSTRIFLYQVLL